MGAYRKDNLSHYQGRFFRWIGKQLNTQGKATPKRFLLGKDESIARLAAQRLEKLWSEIEADFERRKHHARMFQHDAEGIAPGIEIEPLTGEVIEQPLDVLKVEPVWEPHTLAMADVIRKGGSEIHVLPSPPLPRTLVNPEKLDYVARIMNLRDRYTVIAFTASNAALYAEQLKAMTRRVEFGIRNAEAEAQRTQQLTKAAIRTRSGPTLFAAIDAYSQYCRTKDTGGKNEPRDAKMLKRAIQDMPLSAFKFDEIQAIGDYWRSRPPSRRHGANGTPIAVSTVVNMLKTAARFIRWLKRSSSWEWRAPEEWSAALRVDRDKIMTEEERLISVKGPETWTDAELLTLYAYATDRDRLMILLGLNFGFAQSEIRSFRHEDIKPDLDPPRIARLRSKKRRYFEAAVWPETQRALDWLGDHQTPAIPADACWAVLTHSGTRYTAIKIANCWNRLLDRIQKDHPEFRRLPFKYLRKTAYQLVLEASSSEETAGAFQGRSKISSDEFASSYGRRLFGLVHQANAAVRERLQPMFEAAPEAFSKAPRRGSPNISETRRDQIRRLHRQGMMLASIAEEVGVSRQTVYRWIE